MLFAEDEEKPRIVQVEPLKINEILIDGNKKTLGYMNGHIYMNKNPVKRRLMHHTLLITYHDNFLNDGSKINLCVKTITDGKMADVWRGPILVLKLLGLLFLNFNYPKIVVSIHI